MEGSAPLAAWLEAAAALAMPGGTITFIHRADRAAELLSLMEWRAGDIVVCPLWPKKGENAKRVLVQGRAGAAGATRFARGLVLHEADGRYTVEADAVLRGGAMLDLSVL
jgi:tRNA1(Val) A37 N6-methylase TrmN6